MKQSLFEFAAILTISRLPQALGLFDENQGSNSSRLASIMGGLLRRWAGAVAGILVVILVIANKPNGWHQAGIHPDVGLDNKNALLLGLGSAFVFILVLAAIRKFLPGIRNRASLPLDTTRIWIAEAVQYRERHERFAYLTLLALETVSETLIYRGYLVLFLGSQAGTYFLYALASAFLTLLIRANQSWTFRTVVSNLLASFFLIGLTIASQNLLAPITAHLYYNFIIAIQAWRLMSAQVGVVHITGYGRRERLVYGAFIVVNAALLYAAMLWLLGSP